MTVHSKPVVFKEEAPPSVWCKIWYWIEATRVYSACYNFCSRLRRSLAYARFGWSNYDFDSSYALKLLSFKLKRLQHVLTTGHLIQDKETTQSLRLTIRLLDKLHADDYSYFINRHNVKWYGTRYPECGFEDLNDGSDCSRMVFPSEHLPEDKQEKERAEHIAAWDADDALKTRDRRWAFSIIAKYYPYWWD